MAALSKRSERNKNVFTEETDTILVADQTTQRSDYL